MDRVKMVARARTESTTSPAPALQDSRETRVRMVRELRVLKLLKGYDINEFIVQLKQNNGNKPQRTILLHETFYCNYLLKCVLHFVS